MASLSLHVDRCAKKRAKSHWKDSARFFLLSLGSLVPAPGCTFLAELAVTWPPAVPHVAVARRPRARCCSPAGPCAAEQALLLTSFLVGMDLLHLTLPTALHSVLYLSRCLPRCVSPTRAALPRCYQEEEEQEQDGAEDPFIKIKCE